MSLALVRASNISRLPSGLRTTTMPVTLVPKYQALSMNRTPPSGMGLSSAVSTKPVGDTRSTSGFTGWSIGWPVPPSRVVRYPVWHQMRYSHFRMGLSVDSASALAASSYALASGRSAANGPPKGTESAAWLVASPQPAVATAMQAAATASSVRAECRGTFIVVSKCRRGGFAGRTLPGQAAASAVRHRPS